MIEMSKRERSGRKVLESKIETKRRRLILTDSESDDDSFVASPQVKEEGKSGFEPERGEGNRKALVVPGVHENGGGSSIKEKSDIYGSTCKEEAKAGSKIDSSSELFEKREVDDSKKGENASFIKEKNINVEHEAVSSSEIANKLEKDDVSGAPQDVRSPVKDDSKKVLKPKVGKEIKAADNKKKSSNFFDDDLDGNGSVTKKKSREDQLSNKEDVMIEATKVLKSKVTKKREEIGSNKKSSAFSGVDKKGIESSSRKKKNSDSLPSEKEKKVESKNVLRSTVLKEKRESDSGTLGSERKRSRDSLADETKIKRLREELVKRRQEPSIQGKFLKSGYKGCDIDAEDLPGSKPAASVNKQRDGSGEKRKQEDLKKKNKPETENGKWIESSTARTPRKLKDNSTSSQGKDSGERAGMIEGVRVRRDGKETKKCTEKHSLLSEDSKIKKPISATELVKDQLNPGKVSSARRGRPRKEKTNIEASSPRVKLTKADSSSTTSDPIAKEETQSKSKASVVTKLNTKDEACEEANNSRATVKQRVREQIKGILLDAGWKIDLRPRRGRPYEDSVYIPPHGGAGFWSITKAYNVYLERSKKSNEGTSSTFATVPTNQLKMLTRNVAKKRGSGKGFEKNEDLGARKERKISSNTNVYKNSGRKIIRRDTGDTRRKRRGCALLVRGANQDDEDDDDYVPYEWKRTITSWMIDLGVVRADGKVKYMNKKQTQALLEGSLTRDGIRCGCCSKIISISKFEIHAGSKLHQPYQNIFVEETGTSLLQCQLNAWEKRPESERQDFYSVDIEGDDPNDDTCGICGDGGDLICCDGCPSTFHLNCLGIEMLPPDDWHCANCSCKYCGLVSDDVPEESDPDISALLTCSQCEKKYHHQCIPEADDISVLSDDSDISFCGKSCKKVFKRLQKLIGTMNDLESGLSWRLIRRFGEDSAGHSCSAHQKAECNSKIAVAFGVMDECFLPIIDHRSGINLIHNVVFNCGSNINRLSYTGFYTFVLERGDEMIAVASVRIHGTRLAEMPFIGTRDMYRRQGMCRQLLTGIESALYSLNVEKLVIPAISELTETWTGVFGFEHLDLSQRQEVRSTNMLVFPGTGLLYKLILNKGSSKEKTSEGGGPSETASGLEHMPEAGKKYSPLSPKDEAEVADLGLKKTESSASPPRSDFQTLQDKSSGTASDVDLSVQHKEDQTEPTADNKSEIGMSCNGTVLHNQETDNAASTVASGNYACGDTPVHGTDEEVAHPIFKPEAACRHESTREDAVQFSSSDEAKVKVLCEYIMLGNHEVKDEDIMLGYHEVKDEDATTTSLHPVDASSERHATENGDASRVARRSISNLLSIGDTSSQCNSVVHCSSPDIGCSRQQDHEDCSMHVPVLPHDCSSDANQLQSSESTSKTISLAVVKHGLLEACEHIVDANHGGGKLCHYDSETVAEHVDSMERKNLVSSVASNVSVGEGTCTDIHEAETNSDKENGTLIDTSYLKSENGTNSLDQDFLAKSPKVCSSEAVSGVLGLSVCMGKTSGRSSNRVVVQQNLQEANEIVADVSIEPNHCYADRVPDTSTSKDSIAGAIPVHSVGPGSACCASKVPMGSTK